MNRVHAFHHTSFGVNHANKVAEARDAFAMIKEDRELRALARKLAAYAYWQVAEYRVLQEVKGERPRAASS